MTNSIRSDTGCAWWRTALGPVDQARTELAGWQHHLEMAGNENRHPDDRAHAAFYARVHAQRFLDLIDKLKHAATTTADAAASSATESADKSTVGG